VLQVLIGFALAYLHQQKIQGNNIVDYDHRAPDDAVAAVVGETSGRSWYQPQIGLFNYGKWGSSPALTLPVFR